MASSDGASSISVTGEGWLCLEANTETLTIGSPRSPVHHQRSCAAVSSIVPIACRRLIESRTKCDDGTLFLGEGSLAAAPTPKLSSKGLHSVIKVVDDKCL